MSSVRPSPCSHAAHLGLYVDRLPHVDQLWYVSVNYYSDKTAQQVGSRRMTRGQSAAVLVVIVWHCVCTVCCMHPTPASAIAGITNYIDLGIRMIMPLALEGDTAAKQPGLQLGGAWQVGGCCTIVTIKHKL